MGERWSAAPGHSFRSGPMSRPYEATTGKCRVLLVDDEANVLVTLSMILRRKGFAIDVASSAATALEKLESTDSPAFEVVVTDLQMPGEDGLALLKRIGERWPSLPVVILTGYGSIRSAIETTRCGAFEYLVKPASPDEVIEVLRRAVESRPVAATLGGAAQTLLPGPTVVGSSRALLEVWSVAGRVAPTQLPVLLIGESGTGKELLAQAIHQASARRSGPFLPVNCAAINPGLAEATFFGYRRGAFTGADDHREGVFQAARGGTLFLDEIADFPLSAQGVILRALQEGRATPVGGTAPEVLDVRVVSATNRDLEQEVAAGRFRSDLLFRLNAVTLTVPPLRERMDDIPQLVESFLRERGGHPLGDDGFVQALLRHDWPGNVRELRNVVDRAVALAAAEALRVDHLPTYLLDAVSSSGQIPATVSRLDLVEIQEIRGALATTGGQKKAAAELLGIDRKRLYRKMRRLGLL